MLLVRFVFGSCSFDMLCVVRLIGISCCCCSLLLLVVDNVVVGLACCHFCCLLSIAYANGVACCYCCLFIGIAMLIVDVLIAFPCLRCWSSITVCVTAIMICLIGC